LESRKTTEFMRAQQSIMEVEKFESTFFQLLSQLESHCEKHFRKVDDEDSMGEKISRALWSTYEVFGKLPKEKQMETASKHMAKLTDTVACVILAQRAMRVVRFVSRAKIAKGTRQSYAAIMRDTIYPSECMIILSNMFEYESARELLREWRIVDISPGFFPCPEVEYYFYPERAAGLGNK
jgi:hypothetical protein